MITDNSIKDSPFKYDSKVWKYPLYFIFMMWFVYWIEYYFGYNFNTFGIFPRTYEGLKGVLLSPFIHGSAQHLLNNSMPLFVLMAATIYFYRPVAAKVVLFGILISGFLTWLIGSEAYHIGASGLIYVLAGFIFFSGVLRKSLRLVAISLAVAFWYGGMIWYVFPIVKNMSWEGHLSGLITGILLAYRFRSTGLVKQDYQFTETEFDTYFDEEGNFNPPEIEDSNDETTIDSHHPSS